MTTGRHINLKRKTAAPQQQLGKKFKNNEACHVELLKQYNPIQTKDSNFNDAEDEAKLKPDLTKVTALSQIILQVTLSKQVDKIPR